jgi:hypothetical protein
MVRICLGNKISDIGSGAISGNYRNGPATVLNHLGMKFRFLAVCHAEKRSDNASNKVGSLVENDGL